MQFIMCTRLVTKHKVVSVGVLVETGQKNFGVLVGRGLQSAEEEQEPDPVFSRRCGSQV